MDDLEQLLTDDDALGRRAAMAILASDAALEWSLDTLLCGDDAATS